MVLERWWHGMPLHWCHRWSVVVSVWEQQNLGKVCSNLCDPLGWKACRAHAKSVFFLISILSLFSICHDTSAQYAPTTQASSSPHWLVNKKKKRRSSFEKCTYSCPLEIVSIAAASVLIWFWIVQLAEVAKVEAKNYDHTVYALDQLMKLLLSQLINSFWKKIIAISSSSSSSSSLIQLFDLCVRQRFVFGFDWTHKTFFSPLVNEHRERKKERKMGSSFCCSWRRRRRRSNKSMMMMMVSMQLLLLQSLVCLSAAKQTGEQSAPPSSASCQAWLVQSIPTDMPELPAVPGVLRTGDVLQWLAGNSSKSLDIMSYYWELLALPKNPASGDYGYSQQQLDQFGAPVGQAVYDSLIAAADRGVPIR